MNRDGPVWILLAGLLLAAGCSAKRPVLYPNDHFRDVGREAAQKDIDECFELAAQQGLTEGDGGEEAAKRATERSATGAAAGAASGAARGDPGRGAAAGAAGAGAGSFMSGLFKSDEPDPVLRRFVERCLREKGYEVVGWK